MTTSRRKTREVSQQSWDSTIFCALTWRMVGGGTGGTTPPGNNTRKRAKLCVQKEEMGIVVAVSRILRTVVCRKKDD